MSFLDDILKIGEEKEVTGLTDELKSLYVYNKYKQENKSVLLVTFNLHQAGKYYTSIGNHTDKVWFFPMDDFLTSEAIAISPEFKNSRLDTLNNLVNKKSGIIVTNLMGFLRFLPPKEKFKNSYITLKVDQEYKQEELIKKLFQIGYKRETIVNMTGDIALRGFVLDVFPLNSDNPIRIEFWGDTIESIKTFDVDTQRATKNIKEITIFPNTEFIIDADKFEIPYHDIYKHTKVESILDYIDNPIVIFDSKNDIDNNYKLLQEEILNYNISTNRKDAKYMHNLEEIKYKDYINFENFSTKSNHFKQLLPLPKKTDEINKKLNQYLKDNKKVIICLDNRYQVNHLIDQLDNKKVIYTNENKVFSKKINIITKKLEAGFETDNYVVITIKELYGREKENNYKSKFKYGTKINDINKLMIGDYVVHGSYGIGKYLGIKTISKNKLNKDYIMIEYRDNDKLYIPVEKLDLITKYSGKEGGNIKLNKLGTHEWEKAKIKARKKAEDIAQELLDLYAIRESKEGFAFPKDTEEQLIFESEFEYRETEDQIKVIDEIKKDMESSHPMDRLLCGDVGYGKTEVAFRSIFKCIMAGKQAAILCPTTILSSQHYKNAIKRFESFAVNIAILNRFVSKAQQTETINKLKEGKIDLLIGTHRILSDDIEYKDLGLLIIDEEQRFGVKHKEKIKKYKNTVDVLTLSATPIPRTLQLSMSGIRSLSLIETPPEQRYPIQTYVVAENERLIKEAIYKELARKGQTFILFNHIENLESKKSHIQTLVPDAKIAIAHGQMDKNDLEKVMEDFSNGQYDVLLCTTIIETGIDIPSVNTLIIMEADRFGLSQLYQIRGRIGRSNKIAYCYLMYSSKKILSETALKRLKVIKDFTELGSGFAIAMRDLSIRGAGDILGKEQAGFIASVGVELFLEMVNDAVNKLKGIKKPEIEEKEMPLIDVETAIPNSYIEDEDLKIEIHKKISQIDSYKKLNEVKEELEDRFGKVSEDIIIYMHEELFEKKASEIGINNIRQTKNFVDIILDEKITKNLDGEKLFLKLNDLSRMFRFGNKFNKLVITLDTVKLDKHFIYYLIDFVNILKECQKK